ncbi:hypothetical protein KPATCC21470_0769 [Kitasatospora purpeofusca]
MATGAARTARGGAGGQPSCSAAGSRGGCIPGQVRELEGIPAEGKRPEPARPPQPARPPRRSTMSALSPVTR